jgi:hypothetical protein
MGIFSPPSRPYLPPMPSPPPPPTTPVDRAAEDAALRLRSGLAAASGVGSTNRTGGQGVPEPAQLRFKTLLGS